MQVKYEVGDQILWEENDFAPSVHATIKEIRGAYYQIETSGGQIRLVPRLQVIPTDSTIRNARIL